MFDNVFAEPTAYREFVRTGTWPDGTSLVLESRGATSKGSINQHGKFQNGDVMGVEIHVKDTKRFQGGWAFFAFDSPGRGEEDSGNRRLATPVTSSTPRLIRRSCSSIQHC